MATVRDLLLSDLAEDIKECQLCPLHATRNKAVPGVGKADAPAFLIAEKPAAREDITGYPLAGGTGITFDEILQEVGLRRSDFFLTNTVKCKPPGNSSPTLQAIDTCKSWLDKQITFVAPKLLVLCGTYAVANFFPGEKIGDIHGKPRRTWDFMVMATYHPAVLFHNERLRDTVIADFRIVKELIYGRDT